ncbi:hypothetical protein R6Q59_028622 [Mikania micrantha]
MKGHRSIDEDEATVTVGINGRNTEYPSIVHSFITYTTLLVFSLSISATQWTCTCNRSLVMFKCSSRALRSQPLSALGCFLLCSLFASAFEFRLATD